MARQPTLQLRGRGRGRDSEPRTDLQQVLTQISAIITEQVFSALAVYSAGLVKIKMCC